MNEYVFVGATITLMFICAGIWCGTRELFRRWVNNDWCKHNWGMWEAVSVDGKQHRFCKKCNKGERRYL